MALRKETLIPGSVVQVMNADVQPNGTVVVRAGTDAEAAAAVADSLPFTVETSHGRQLNQNGTVTAVARNDSELPAAILSGRPYSLPGLKRIGRKP